MADAAESTAMHADVVGHTILHEVARGIATITLNRPDAANALQPEQRDAIIDLLTAAGSTNLLMLWTNYPVQSPNPTYACVSNAIFRAMLDDRRCGGGDRSGR